MTRTCRALSLLALLFACSPMQPLRQIGHLQLASVCTDGMVVQQNSSAAIFGTTVPHETIRVEASWSGAAPCTAAADARGRFLVHVPTPAAGGPFELQITCSTHTVRIHDVLVGEVWLASGQSNMEMAVGDSPGAWGGVVNWREEVARAGDPLLRLFTVAKAAVAEPAQDVRGSWVAATTDSVTRFSATAYFFARKLRKDLGVPVGVIASDWGGTPVESWTSPQALIAQGDFAKALAEVQTKNVDKEKIAAERQRWWSDLEAKRPSFSGPGVETADLPHVWGKTVLKSFDGVVWYERDVTIGSDFADRALELVLGPIDDMDTVFWDSEGIGRTHEAGHWNETRQYTVPARLATAGPHKLCVLALDTSGEGGLGGTASSFLLRLPGVGARNPPLPLATGWRWQRGPELGRLPNLPSEPSIGAWTPAALYHGMIAPLVPFTLRGVLWYQGESNRERAAQYRELFPALIRDWRKQWGSELAFYFVQIAPFAYGGDRGEAADLRAAQESALVLPHTGMAVTLDVGDARDIHPKEKRVVGERLALHALRDAYSRADVVADAPRFANLAQEGAALRVRFVPADRGLVSRDGKALRGFEIAGADGKWMPATATSDGESLLVSHPEIGAPMQVRYAWSAAPDTNLGSRDGLPVAPFRGSVH